MKGLLKYPLYKMISLITDTMYYRFLRGSISFYYLKGYGIEIGALHKPLILSSKAKVKYVDRLPNEKLKIQYPELKDCKLVNVDIVDDGEVLSKIEDSSQDFVIANHFIEHCENPILAIKNMMRVLIKGGVLYMAIPDKRLTFDKNRKNTEFEHLIKDYKDGPEWSRNAHFEEWTRHKLGITESKQVEEKVKELIGIDYSIHFHVWDQRSMMKFMSEIMTMLNIDIELAVIRGVEVIFILKKM